MMQPLRILAASLFSLFAISFNTARAEDSAALMPYIDGSWWQVAGDPDLGEYTTEGQQPVDFAVWQAADGTWQLWSCIRKTNCGGKTRLFHGWEGKSITDPDWKPMGIKMEADKKYGETPGGLQAPHVVKEGDTFYFLYGDWEHICVATGKDGKKFERYVLPNGKTGLFTEGLGTNTRDIVAIKIGDLWHGYYTAYPNRQGAVYCRTSPDLKNWSESTNVAFGGRSDTGPFSAECPHVVERNGKFYLFRTQKYGENSRTSVYCSDDPMNFGLNQDRLYFVCEMPVAAIEIVQHEGQDYMAALLPSLKGIQIAKLGWTKKPKQGEAVFNLNDAEHRREWKKVSGELPSIFTQSKRDRFDAPASSFIGSAEQADGKFDDRLTSTIESPAFKIDSDWFFAYLSGGVDAANLYVAVLDADSGEELMRVSPSTESNTLAPHMLNASSFVGRTAKVRVVDNSTKGWGHINFGGLYRGTTEN